MAEGNLAPQPDLHRLSDGLRVAPEESSKLQNLPAFDAGAAILAAIDALRTDIGTRLTRIEDRMTANDRNNTARVQNAHVTSPTEPLERLVNPRTGAEVTSFPPTTRALNGLTSDQLEVVLQALGLEIRGNQTEKQMRLRRYIGLRGE